jgi:hypothetical protein
VQVGELGAALPVTLCVGSEQLLEGSGADKPLGNVSGCLTDLSSDLLSYTEGFRRPMSVPSQNAVRGLGRVRSQFPRGRPSKQKLRSIRPLSEMARRSAVPEMYPAGAASVTQPPAQRILYISLRAHSLRSAVRRSCRSIILCWGIVSLRRVTIEPVETLSKWSIGTHQ